MDRLGIEHEIVDAVEIDKYAMASFNAIHGTKFEPQDITTWNKDIECDLIMHGSPCQDFSLAGKQAGGDIGSGTRSSLMYETVRIVGKLRPKYVVWENVKNVLSKKHRHNFDNYLTAMQSLGYTNYYEVLNAKDYGIPQNRERVFTVSILKEITVYDDYNSNIRKDQNTIGTLTTNCGISTIRNGWKIIEHNKIFKFPPKQELKLRLKDMLEDEVDRKYYLSDEYTSRFVASTKDKKYPCGKEYKVLGTTKAATDKMGTNSRHWVYDTNDCISTLDSTMYKQPKQILQVGELDIKGLDCIKRVYSDDGLSPTLTDMQGGNRQPKIMIKNATKKGYIEAQDGDSVNLAYPDSETRRGRVGNQVAQTLQCTDNMGVVTSVAMRGRYDENGDVKQQLEVSNREVANAITTVQKDSMIAIDSEEVDLEDLEYQEMLKADEEFEKNGFQSTCPTGGVTIRKLTPKECWRLMGFDDKDFDRAAQVNSNTQLYKQAGNSIVVNVLEAIFKELLKEE